MQFTYDELDQLRTEILPDGQTNEYRYDGFGNRNYIKIGNQEAVTPTSFTKQMSPNKFYAHMYIPLMASCLHFILIQEQLLQERITITTTRVVMSSP